MSDRVLYRGAAAAPRAFPQYGPHCYATFFLDPHGFMIEVVSHEPEAPN